MKTVEETIQSCIKMIAQTTIVAGVGNGIVAPMVSVILGREAEDHLPTIKAVYESYWAFRAQGLSYWVGTYTKEALEDACVDALVRGRSMEALKRDNIKAAYYWDLMDDRFEAFFEAVKQPFSPPCVHARVFYIFCRQMRSEERAITEERLGRVLKWAEEMGEHVLVLSNISNGGIFGEEEIYQNYQLAATIQFLMNAASATESNGAKLAQELEFNFQNHQLWTAGYATQSRRYREIAYVSLLQILERIYDNAGTEPERVRQPERRGSGMDPYIELLDRLFVQVLEPLCPDEEERRFWEDLPRTEDMEALARKLSGEETPAKNSFFKRIFASRKDDSWQNAIPSVQEIWDVCVRCYYLDPIREWMTSQNGRREVSKFFNEHFAQKMSLNEMTRLADDVYRLRNEEQYQNPLIPMPEPTEPGKYSSLAAYLHECACCVVKQAIYRELLLNIAAVMEQLSVRAKNFKPLMDMMLPSFRGVSVSDGIRDSYGPYTRRLLDANPELIAQHVLPCADEGELLSQLEAIFQELAQNRDTENRYCATLLDDIKFQIANGNAAAANNVVTECFGEDLESMGRLRSYRRENGYLYCILNDGMRELMNGIQTENIGKQFVVNRSDRIERIYLYPISLDAVEYRTS